MAEESKCCYVTGLVDYVLPTRPECPHGDNPVEYEDCPLREEEPDGWLSFTWPEGRGRSICMICHVMRNEPLGPRFMGFVYGDRRKDSTCGRIVRSDVEFRTSGRDTYEVFPEVHDPATGQKLYPIAVRMRKA